MSIIYKKAKIKNSKNPKNGQTYGRAVVLETITTKQLAEEVSHSTTVTRADVVAVLTEACVQIKHHLLNSQGVKLDELGTFKPALKTKSIAETDDVKFGPSQILGARINYAPDTYFTPNGKTGTKGGRCGFRTKMLVEGASFKLYDDLVSKPASTSSTGGTQTNP